jgi:type II secretory ATPase GspE/PulE/Tfp pilus assembly ATPase PilB-like protein
MKNTVREMRFEQNTLWLTFTNETSETNFTIKFVYDDAFFRHPLIADLRKGRLLTNKYFPCSIDERYVKLVVFQGLRGDVIEYFYKKNKRAIICYQANRELFLEGLQAYKALEERIRAENSNNLKQIFAENDHEVKEDRETEAYKDIGSALSADSPMIVKGVGAVIDKGLELRASDIHIEPLSEYVRVRYRIDGILAESNRIPANLLPGIISRLKIMADLDITERRLPQDGGFQLTKNNDTLDFRLSVIPTINGEKAVIRILDRKLLSVRLEDLGLSAPDYGLLRREITRSKGIILISGPTGSGKTSTLYAVLQTLDSTALNIETVEDPVEYKIDGVSQVQCHNDVGRTFAATLRAFLRQDPDVLMIGEIRDPETAEIAIKAALTGHLVLSTVHTNDAIGCIYRLINIGIPPYMLSASVNLVMAQRLVRKLCPHCRAPDADYRGKLAFLGETPASGDENAFYTGKGCPRCANTGYQGRTGVFELLALDGELREAIDRGATLQELEKTARNKGLRYLREHGIEKARAGVTSLDEIIRLT